MYENYKALKIERRGRVLVVTMDNPPMNSSTPEMHGELSHIFRTINRDHETAVVVLTGGGERAFSAGGDISRMVERLEAQDHQDWIRTTREAKEVLYSLLQLNKPLITRINGHAMGLGSSLAVMGDFSYMIETGKIADTHVKLGLAAGDGGSLMWPLLMGFLRARRYLLTSDPMTGKEAAELGLITASASTFEELDELAYGMAERLASGATQAINHTKMAINLLLRKLLEGMVEAQLGGETFTYMSQDHLIAAKAFMNKEQPVFTGK
jgi:enoyl-CoA hydratase